MSLQLSQTQQQALSPQVLQRIEMLQMNSLELVEYIEQLALENPLIELQTQTITKQNVPYIVPDLTIEWDKNGFQVTANDSYLPSIQFSTTYCNLLSSTSDQQLKNYIVEKLKQAQQVVENINQRKNTILRCVEMICKLQEGFFQHGLECLTPMTLADVANPLEIHESTVSRALQNKYFQCNLGVFSFQQLFSTSVGGKESGISNSRVKWLLQKIIQEENKAKPLSDQKICLLLEEQGVIISRRAIAKYRGELEIPNTMGRKVNEQLF